ncbi:MAG: SRPBCC domain-containing protein [Acidobacteria bacterium]|nr:SRPBCC domain-containing protein [Acidobacteriota bacterium]
MNEIVETIEIRAKAERIFAALTNPEERARWWWGAKGVFEITGMESDLRVGGKWKMSGVGAGGRAINVVGEYKMIDPPRALEFTWLPDWQEGVGETVVRWDLEEKDGVTVVRLRHWGFASESARATYRGWGLVLGGLRGYVERE